MINYISSTTVIKPGKPSSTKFSTLNEEDVYVSPTASLNSESENGSVDPRHFQLKIAFINIKGYFHNISINPDNCKCFAYPILSFNKKASMHRLAYECFIPESNQPTYHVLIFC